MCWCFVSQCAPLLVRISCLTNWVACFVYLAPWPWPWPWPWRRTWSCPFCSFFFSLFCSLSPRPVPVWLCLAPCRRPWCRSAVTWATWHIRYGAPWLKAGECSECHFTADGGATIIRALFRVPTPSCSTSLTCLGYSCNNEKGVKIGDCMYIYIFFFLVGPNLYVCLEVGWAVHILSHIYIYIFAYYCYFSSGV